ncbi:MAG TPA: epoxide hydrolase [Bryobacteraceae bacterium]|nr:epoxide hydrolase [Bryobacteraceae bacterium]
MASDSSGKTSRRSMLASLPVAAGIPLLAQSVAKAPAGGPRPFKVKIPQATIDRILRRVREFRWPDRLDGNDWRYGVDWDYMKALAEYWTTAFDWRKAEANLNRYPQFLARVEDFDIHFYHVKGRGPRPIPLILTHGWPGSVFEFLEAIGPLTDPASAGGSVEDAFDVVIPSLPGFGFSSKPRGVPVGPPTTARLWHKLMTEVLGYAKFGAQGGDWGQAVTVQLARDYPDSLLGIHLNAAGAAAATDGEPPEEVREWLRSTNAYRTQELDYFNEQQHKPQTVAFALSDNPVGAAAWIVEKFKAWSDSGNNLDQTFSKDQILTDVMLYLVTETTGTGVWFYRGSADDRSMLGSTARGKVNVPTGFASFPKEMPPLNPPRSVLAQTFNLVHYTKMPRGGHFACLEQPALFVEDVRLFFRKLRA